MTEVPEEITLITERRHLQESKGPSTRTYTVCKHKREIASVADTHRLSTEKLEAQVERIHLLSVRCQTNDTDYPWLYHCFLWVLVLISFMHMALIMQHKCCTSPGSLHAPCLLVPRLKPDWPDNSVWTYSCLQTLYGHRQFAKHYMFVWTRPIGQFTIKESSLESSDGEVIHFLKLSSFSDLIYSMKNK